MPRSQLETLACVNTLVLGELGLNEEEGIALLFRLVAGLAAVIESVGERAPNFEAEKIAAKNNLTPHIEAWAHASMMFGGQDDGQG